MTTYVDFRTEPLATTTHPVIFISDVHIECDRIGCTFNERFDSVDDALTAAEIHEEHEEN